MASNKSTDKSIHSLRDKLQYSPTERRIMEDYQRSQERLVNETRDKLKKYYSSKK